MFYYCHNNLINKPIIIFNLIYIRENFRIISANTP